MTTRLSGPMLPARSGTPKQLMVLLHGYGADGRDLISLGIQWRELWPDMLFVAPNAPEACALGQGFQWFPVDPDRRVETWRTGPVLAAPVLVNFLTDVWAQTGIAAADTVLVGFSQGTMMALHVGTALPERLAAIVGFSGSFSPAAGFAEGKFAKPPVALIHGDSDTMVEPGASRDAAELLIANDFDVSLHFSAGVGHGIAPDGLDFATAFLLSQIAAKA